MKKFLSLIMTIIFIVTLSVPSAAEAATFPTGSDAVTSIVYLENGDYLETTITTGTDSGNLAPCATYQKTGTKTTSRKNDDGEVLWSVSVTGTFTYTGSSSTCTSVSGTSKSNHSSWKVSKATTSKSGNTAKASATGKRYILGICVQTSTLNVTLTCSSTGVLS